MSRRKTEVVSKLYMPQGSGLIGKEGGVEGSRELGGGDAERAPRFPSIHRGQLGQGNKLGSVLVDLSLV
jgi:hypothetical protein